MERVELVSIVGYYLRQFFQLPGVRDVLQQLHVVLGRGRVGVDDGVAVVREGAPLLRPGAGRDVATGAWAGRRGGGGAGLAQRGRGRGGGGALQQPAAWRERSGGAASGDRGAAAGDNARVPRAKAPAHHSGSTPRPPGGPPAGA
jgi:hypothetical protein